MAEPRRRRPRIKRRGFARVRVHELQATNAALGKLGARGISAHEAEQLLRNAHTTIRNRHDAPLGAQRRLLIGRTDGGQVLTLVIEETLEPTTWLIVTGWPSTPTERMIVERT